MKEEEERNLIRLSGNLASVDGINAAADSAEIIKLISKNEFDLSHLDNALLLKVILKTTQDGFIVVCGDGNIIDANESYYKMTGYSKDDLKTLNIRDIVPQENDHMLQKRKETIVANGTALYETVEKKKDGSFYNVEVSATCINKDPPITVCFIRDITDRKNAERSILHSHDLMRYIIEHNRSASYSDYLTGLYNRRYMEDSIRRLDTSRNIPLTLMVIDVNGLKLTNDAFGHKTGDQLLKKVAAILKKACRADDIIGRMGGDEFCILLPHTDEKQAEGIKARIQAAASNLKLDPVVLSLAVGHAAKSSPEQDIKAVMTAADNLMYKDKVKYGKFMRSQTIEMVLHHINANYEQEQLHTQKVSQYCEATAKAMNFNKKEVRDVKNAAALHDIGKIMVPPQILNKPGKLTPEEFGIIKRHPEIGYQMLKSVDEYVTLAEYVLHHHERWDGTGYPEGLCGENIPLYSRIIAVADAFEAMTALRPYQKTKNKEEAVTELIRCSGVQFDPDIVKVFIEKIL